MFKRNHLPITLTKRLDAISKYFWQKTAKKLFKGFIILAVFFIFIASESTLTTIFFANNLQTTNDNKILNMLSIIEFFISITLMILTIIMTDVSFKIWKQNKIFIQTWLSYGLITLLFLNDLILAIHSYQFFSIHRFQKWELHKFNNYFKQTQSKHLKNEINKITSSFITINIFFISYITTIIASLLLASIVFWKILEMVNYRSTILAAYKFQFITIDWKKLKIYKEIENIVEKNKEIKNKN